MISKLPAYPYQNRIPNTLAERAPTTGARTQNVYNFGSHISYRTRVRAPAIEGLCSPQSSTRQICPASLITKLTIRMQELIYGLFRFCRTQNCRHSVSKHLLWEVSLPNCGELDFGMGMQGMQQPLQLVRTHVWQTSETLSLRVSPHPHGKRTFLDQ